MSLLSGVLLGRCALHPYRIGLCPCIAWWFFS
jgi:hypothetical protein